MSQKESFFERLTSRREFLKMSCKGAAGVAVTMSVLNVMTGGQAGAQGVPYTILQTAKGVITANPTRCVGCRRCELVCSGYNDGKTQPHIARVKVGRNYNFGFQGPSVGYWRGEGEYGNFLIRPETCKQCKHPVPCQTACPQNAIVADAATGARKVDEAKCIGCGMCAAACPWAMITVDRDKKKAVKCFLCDGAPKCVDNCPTGALTYIPWTDTTRLAPMRNHSNVIPVGSAFNESCGACHKP